MKYLFTLYISILSFHLHGIDVEKAHIIYNRDFKKADAGIFEKDGLIFFRVEVPLGGAGHSAWEKSMLAEEALFAHRELVSNYLIKLHSIKRSPIPFGSILDKFPKLEDFIDQNNASFFQQLINFNLECVFLENARLDDVLRYTVAYSANDLEEAAPMEILWPSNQEIVTELQRIKFEISELHRLSELKQFQIVTNNIIDGLKDNFLELSQEYKLVSNTDFSEFGHVEFYRRVRTADIMLDKNNTVQNAKKILDKLSLFPTALKSLSDHYLEENLPKSFVFYLIGLPTHSGHIKGVEYEEFDFTDHEAGNSFYSKLAKLEMKELVQTVQNYSLPEELSDIPEFRYNFYKLGFHFINQMRTPEHSSYERALKLFQSGKDLKLIFSECLEAVQEDPNHSESWNLLGRSLSLQGFDLLAIPCFLHAILVSKEEYSIAKINLAISLQNLGFIEVAKGAALSVLLSSEPSIWQINEAIKVLGISAD